MPENDNIDTSFGDLAQLVEHTAHIRDVNGSIPLVAIKRLFYKSLFFFIKIAISCIFYYEICREKKAWFSCRNTGFFLGNIPKKNMI